MCASEIDDRGNVLGVTLWVIMLLVRIQLVPYWELKAPLDQCCSLKFPQKFSSSLICLILVSLMSKFHTSSRYLRKSAVSTRISIQSILFPYFNKDSLWTFEWIILSKILILIWLSGWSLYPFIWLKVFMAGLLWKALGKYTYPLLFVTQNHWCFPVLFTNFPTLACIHPFLVMPF